MIKQYMKLQFLLMIGIVILLIGYYLYVLYWTLQKKRKFDKSSDASELYVRNNAFYLLLFGDLFKNNKKNNYKILKEKLPEDQHSDIKL